MNIKRFDRHEHMDDTTRGKILDLISDLNIIENCKSFNVINMLYGLFDGFDYSELIESDNLLKQLKRGGNTALVKEILVVTKIIKRYPVLIM